MKHTPTATGTRRVHSADSQGPTCRFSQKVATADA